MTASTARAARRSQRAPSGRFAINILATALLLTIGAIGALGWCLRDAHNSLRTLQVREFRLQGLIGEIKRIDEILAMSTRMAVATGDLQWEVRYRRFEPMLDAAISEVLQLAPQTDALEGISRTAAATEKLTGIEYRCFELLRKGRGEEASALLAGADFARHENEYKQGLQESLSALQADLVKTLESKRKRANQAVAATVGVLPLLLFSWLYALRTLRSYLKARRRAEEALTRSEAVLRNLV
ncbi:MAG: hypothetical protein ACE5HE_15170, partial [Phycisphaerae bacterium]